MHNLIQSLCKMNYIDNIVFEYQKIEKDLEQLQSKFRSEEFAIEWREEEIENYKEKFKIIPLHLKIFKRQKYLEDKKNYQDYITRYNSSLINHKENSRKIYAEMQNLEISKKTIEEAAKKSMSNRFEQVKREIKSKISYDEKGIPIIYDDEITEFDSFLDNKIDKENFSFDDIVLVRSTDFFPDNGIINSLLKNQIVFPLSLDIDNKTINSNFISQIDSVHFSLNGRVSSHEFGNWDNNKYIIIEPIKHQLDNISNIYPVDTWSNGSIKLSEEAIIMVKNQEYDKLSEEAISKYNIIKFKGDSKTCTNKMLLLLGYKPQTIEKFNWRNNENEKTLKDFVEKNYKEKQGHADFASKATKVNNLIAERDAFINYMRNETLNTQKGVEINPNEMNQLFKFYLEFNKKSLSTIDGKTIEEANFGIFLKNWGVRLFNDKIYLLDTKSIIDSYENEIDINIINQIYNIYKQNILENIKRDEILNKIICRNQELSRIRNETVNFSECVEINNDELYCLYWSYPHNHYNIDEEKDNFLKEYGVRISEDKIYLLDDNSVIDSYINELDPDITNQIYAIIKKTHGDKLEEFNRKNKL